MHNDRNRIAPSNLTHQTKPAKINPIIAILEFLFRMKKNEQMYNKMNKGSDRPWAEI